MPWNVYQDLEILKIFLEKSQLCRLTFYLELFTCMKILPGVPVPFWDSFILSHTATEVKTSCSSLMPCAKGRIYFWTKTFYYHCFPPRAQKEPVLLQPHQTKKFNKCSSSEVEFKQCSSLLSITIMTDLMVWRVWNTMNWTNSVLKEKKKAKAANSQKFQIELLMAITGQSPALWPHIKSS